MDLPTLNSILLEYGVSSNYKQQQFNIIYNKLNISSIIQLFEEFFEGQVYSQFKALSKKHRSCLSRTLVTVVLDDSIFKQWLSSFETGETYQDCSGCFFSGQYRSTVYGFKNSCIVIVIDGIYSPLYFDYVKKGTVTKEDKTPNSIKTAIKLINRIGALNSRFEKEEIGLGDLHFSADNGYSHTNLSACCSDNNLIYSSVPKKNHLFEIDGEKIKLSNWIKTVYLSLEEEHNKNQEHLPKGRKTAFIYRFKGNYLSKNLKVTLLAFRLNGSKKISIIYSTSSTIFAKTMRRHWFQRTYIEQFFKTMKHVLKIQESRTRNKNEFTFKFLRFAFMALHVQKIVRFVHIKIKQYEKKGFIFIQRILRKSKEFDDLLQDIIFSKYWLSIS